MDFSFPLFFSSSPATTTPPFSRIRCPVDQVRLYLEPASQLPPREMMTQRHQDARSPFCPFPLCNGRRTRARAKDLPTISPLQRQTRDRSRERQWPAHHSSPTLAPTSGAASPPLSATLLLRPRKGGTDQSGLQASSFPPRREFAAAVDSPPPPGSPPSPPLPPAPTQIAAGMSEWSMPWHRLWSNLGSGKECRIRKMRLGEMRDKNEINKKKEESRVHKAGPFYHLYPFYGEIKI